MGRDLWLSGDGHCDRPGYNAKYGTYAMTDQKTDKIVGFKVVQVSNSFSPTISLVFLLTARHFSLENSVLDQLIIL